MEIRSVISFAYTPIVSGFLDSIKSGVRFSPLGGVVRDAVGGADAVASNNIICQPVGVCSGSGFVKNAL